MTTTIARFARSARAARFLAATAFRMFAGLAAAMLAACSAPPAERAPTPVPVFRPLPPPVSTPAQAPAAPPAAVPGSPTAAAAPAETASAPYGPAVAARFPDPAERYDTPAFASGRTAFTGNAEIASSLRALVRDGGAAGTTVRLVVPGRSASGQPIEGLLFTRSPESDALGVLRAGRPTVLLIGQQHGDEPAGAEALLVIAQRLARGPLEPLLDRINVLLVPRANPDGADASRRGTAGGLDANRDHLLLQTPEAQALAQLARDYRPTVIVDAHEYSVVGRWLEKFGAIQRYDALLQYATTPNLHPFVTRAAEEWFRRPVVSALQRAGLTSEWYYTTSTDLADRKVSMGGTRPDTLRNVGGLRHAVSLLVETRGVGIGRLHLARRVQTHVVAITTVLEASATRAADLAKLRSFVENDTSALACTGELVVEADPTSSEYGLKMLDPVTGADRSVPVAWDSALQLRPRKTRPRPCGYWLAPEQTEAVRRLRALGVAVQRADVKGVVRGETWRELSREAVVRQDVRGTIADAEQTVRVAVEPVPALLDVPVGSWYVPLDQPLAHLATVALEPDTQDSFVAHRIVDRLPATARVLARPEFRLTAVP